MKTTLEKSPVKEKLPDPVQFIHAEPWQWEVLAKAFLTDPVLNFWVGEKTNLKVLEEFFEAVVKDALTSGGTLFSTPDQKAVLVWTWLGSTLEAPNEWRERWYEILDPEGVKRYYGLYEAGDVAIDPSRRKKCMLPDYMAVLPEAQGQGYGSHLLKWTMNYFDERGLDSPFILASTPRSAKLYCPLVGFQTHREVPMGEGPEAPLAVFLRRNGSAAWEGK